MRPRTQNILLPFVSVLPTAIATTNCNNSPKESDQEHILVIEFSSSDSFHVIEEDAKENSYMVDTHIPVTLFFYDARGEPTKPYRVGLKNNEDTRKARSTDGYEMEVRKVVSKVSAVAGIPGIIKLSRLDDRKTYNL